MTFSASLKNERGVCFISVFLLLFLCTSGKTYKKILYFSRTFIYNKFEWKNIVKNLQSSPALIAVLVSEAGSVISVCQTSGLCRRSPLVPSQEVDASTLTRNDTKNSQIKDGETTCSTERRGLAVASSITPPQKSPSGSQRAQTNFGLPSTWRRRGLPTSGAKRRLSERWSTRQLWQCTRFFSQGKLSLLSEDSTITGGRSFTHGDRTGFVCSRCSRVQVEGYDVWLFRDRTNCESSNGNIWFWPLCWPSLV